jgi:hypothetical protein
MSSAVLAAISPIERNSVADQVAKKILSERSSAAGKAESSTTISLQRRIAHGPELWVHGPELWVLQVRPGMKRKIRSATIRFGWRRWMR